MKLKCLLILYNQIETFDEKKKKFQDFDWNTN